MTRSLVVYNENKKSLAPWDVDDERGWTPLGGKYDNTVERTYFKRVPWLYRGITDRALNVSSMPYNFTKDGDEVELKDGQEFPDDLSFLEGLEDKLYRAEQSLGMTAAAFFVMETNPGGYVKDLVYCAPTTISLQPVNYDAAGKIVSYTRTLRLPNGSSVSKTIPAANVLAIYLPDYATESGQPDASPAIAALSAAGVLFNTAGFVSSFFAKGAIKATILTVESGSNDEVKRLTRWFEDVVAGIKNAWASVILRVKMAAPFVIGEGLESLQNDSLTNSQRADVAAALGVPEGRLRSAAANYATRIEDEIAYFRGTIIPECKLIASAFRKQLFTAEHHLDGYALEFNPEELDIFQEDEAQRATSLKTLTDAGIPLLMAMDILGYDLTDEQRTELEDAAAQKDERAQALTDNLNKPPETAPVEQQPPQAAPVEQPAQLTQAQRKELEIWQRKAIKALKAGDSANCEFAINSLSMDMADEISESLINAQTPEDVKAIFAAFDQATPVDPLLAMASAINRAVDALAV